MGYVREVIPRFIEAVAKLFGSRKAWVWMTATALLLLGKIDPTSWVVVSGIFIGSVATEKLLLK